MFRWQLPLALIALLVVPAAARAQGYPATPYPTSRYPSTSYPTSRYPMLRYPSTAPAPAGRPRDPAAAAARQQSGLSESDARTLLQNRGYTQLNEVRADPGSVWVWQADGIKDGRPVRVGIDYRGKVLTISPEGNRPCAAPGVDFGIGGLGVGARLSAVGSCAGR